MVTIIGPGCQRLVVLWPTTIPSVTCTWQEQGITLLLYIQQHQLVTFFSPEVYRLNLEQGKFLSSLKTQSE